ncbi:hypothetical protein BH10PAT4_BH10PAT4_0870 [soil metagenome]
MFSKTLLYRLRLVGANVSLPGVALLAKSGIIADNRHMLKRVKVAVTTSVFVLFLALFSAPHSYADPIQSTNYKFNESAIGSGGLNQSSSASYTGRDSIGDIGIGNSASSSYQVNAGSTTTNDPALSVSIGGAAVNFGNFTASSAITATSTFTILNYTSYGYVVYVFGNPPTNGATTLSALSTTSASTAGVSQFGINLVANTSPVSVGANPNIGQFGFGSAAVNYNTSNMYRYVSGEQIAQATKSSGLTTYTITYLVNVAPLATGGIYTSDQTIIVVGTY